MKAGDAFLILAEQPKRHLWVIISDPEANPDRVLYVSITTARTKSDPACFVNGGEHESIQHLSYAYYRDPRCDSLKRLQALRDQCGLHMKEPVSNELLQRLRDGARVTDFLPFTYVKLLVDQELIEPGED